MPAKYDYQGTDSPTAGAYAQQTPDMHKVIPYSETLENIQASEISEHCDADKDRPKEERDESNHSVSQQSGTSSNGESNADGAAFSGAKKTQTLG
jgi:hypothetical protein